MWEDDWNDYDEDAEWYEIAEEDDYTSDRTAWDVMPPASSKSVATGEVSSNSADSSHSSMKETEMANVQIGSTFKTGNAVVAGLPVGSVLQVSAQGTLEVVEVPSSIPSVGDEVETKYGTATVVSLTSQIDRLMKVANGSLEGFIYIADDNVVRSATV